MLHYYFGNGKGKSSNAVGLTFRALGAGQKILFTHFFKNGLFECSEDKILRQFKDRITLKSFVVKEWVDFNNLSLVHKKALELFWEEVLQEIEQNNPDVIILDEFAYILNYNLLDTDKVYEWLESVAKEKEVVITGRPKMEKMLSIADYASEIKEYNHPYQKGVTTPRVGIDY